MSAARHSTDSRETDRLRIPERCPACDAEVRQEEIAGTFLISGSGDRDLAFSSHGILAREGDAIEWLSVNALCSSADCQWSHLTVLAAD